MKLRFFFFFFGLTYTLNAYSAEIKTSSLTPAKAPTTTLPKQCQQMFQEADKLISDAEKQPGIHTQVQQMKSKLSSSKEQILKMDLQIQEKSCDKGLIALNNLKQKY